MPLRTIYLHCHHMSMQHVHRMQAAQRHAAHLVDHMDLMCEKNYKEA
jgi:hypothetical protein